MRDRALLPIGTLCPVSWSRAIPRRPIVFSAGVPCQGTSVVGPRDGGGESELWPDICATIAVICPQIVVLENSGHRWRAWVPVVRRDLWNLGYESLPILIKAGEMGAPHERSRAFVVAHPNGEFVRELQGWWSRESGKVASELGQPWLQQSGVSRVDDGVPYRVERNRAIGNAVSPLVAQVIAKGIKAVMNITQQVTHDEK